MRTICCAAILAALTIPTLSDDLTPSAIRAMLDEQDAVAVVESIDEPSWSAFLAHVEAGDRGWIDLVPLLAPGTDGKVAQTLAATLSRALMSNPQGVLGVLASGHYTAANICVDNARETSAFETARFIDEALGKVAAVLDPALMEQRNACLHELVAARISALI